MQLPKAPLLEVIFELRWKVVSTGNLFGYDPGFVPFADAFTKTMTETGFTTHEAVAQPGPPIAHQVAFRYRKEEVFPLKQIGHGIFACNTSTGYEWEDFKAMIGQSIRDVVACYPRSDVTPLVPSVLELRYVDVFNEELLGNVSWQDFIAKATNMRFETLKFLEDVADTGTDRGNLGLQLDLKDKNLGRFELQIANRRGDKPSILVTSKVTKRGFGDAPPARDGLEAFALKWAEDAHEISSKFFQSFVSAPLMAKFREA